MQQDQIVATAEDPVRRQMHLPRRRQVNEIDIRGRIRVYETQILGIRPFTNCTHVHQNGRSEGHMEEPARTTFGGLRPAVCP